MMEPIIKSNEDYLEWIDSLSEKYRQSQIKAAVSVNSEMLKFYWELGKDIDERHGESKWGSHFFKELSKDLKKENSECKMFFSIQFTLYDAVL